MEFEAFAAALTADARWSASEIVTTSEGIEVRRGRARVRLVGGERLIGDAALVGGAVAGEYGLLVLGEAPAGLKELLRPGSPVAVLDDGADGDQAFLAIDGLLERVELRQVAARDSAEISRYRLEHEELVTIARALTQERDIDRLLGLILEKSRAITSADAGSIYVVERPTEETAQLRFKLSQNESLGFVSREFSVPLSLRSLAGAAALIKLPINTPDVYALDPSKPYTFDPSFDRRTGYRTRSMLTVPLISAEDQVIGVIQLINRKERGEVVAFDARSEELVFTLAAQAGIALENALLYAEIRKIFEGFVRASVSAIEQRDPTTSGHSLRVSVFSCGLAEVVDRVESGPYRETHFSPRDMRELEYASLLHDFGKIGVREQVLVKAKKLYPHQAQAIRARIGYAIKSAEVELLRNLIALPDGAELTREALERAFETRRSQLLEAWRTVEAANEPSVLAEGDFSRIAELGLIEFEDFDGQGRRILEADEVVALQIRRGSLSPAEYDEIRSHVVHTRAFLSKVPWGRSMANLPLIAGAHHERLNGTGYPHGWLAEQIPVQSKIMAIADVFDALTARDRPYKRALPGSRAFEILDSEVAAGHLDGELVRLFRDAKIYKSAPPPA